MMHNLTQMANAYVSKFYNTMLDKKSYEALMDASKENFGDVLIDHHQIEVENYIQDQMRIDSWYKKQVEELYIELEEFEASWIMEILAKREYMIKDNVTQDFDEKLLAFLNELTLHQVSAVQEYARLQIDKWFLIALYHNYKPNDTFYDYAKGNISKEAMIELFEGHVTRNKFIHTVYESLVVDEDIAALEHSFDSLISAQMYQYIMDIKDENALFAYAFFKYQEFKNIRMIVKAKLYYVDPIKQRQLLRYHNG